uniref:Tautomerase n=1 Tax=Micromonospora griseorubida TaxID=28040 RepID=Q83WE0_MICGR|nr:tautomerase [Micromonospora griseorubida]
MTSDEQGGSPVLSPPPLRTPPESADDSRLGQHLLTARGLQWLHGANGDAYALLLRGHHDDPYPYHDLVRRRGPLYQSPVGSWVTADTTWRPTVLTDPSFGMARYDGTPAEPQVLPFRAAPRSAGSGRTTPDCDRSGSRGWDRPRSMPGRPIWNRRTARCSRRLTDRFDLVADLPWPAVTTVTAGQLGLPDHQHDPFARTCRDLARIPDSLLTAQQLSVVRAAQAALVDLTALLDRMPHADADRGAVALLLAVIAVPAAVNLIANARLALAAEPDQWSLVRGAPELAADVVRETLRLDPPIQVEARVTHRETLLAGRELPAGAHVVALVGATGRDPRRYADPDRFDLRREVTAAPLALRGDLHTAPVAPLVTAQAEAGLRALAERLPRPRTGTVLRPRRTSVTRGPLAVPISA